MSESPRWDVQAHGRYGTHFVLLPDGERLLSLGAEGAVVVELSEGALLDRYQFPHRRRQEPRPRPRRIVLAPSGRRAEVTTHERSLLSLLLRGGFVALPSRVLCANFWYDARSATYADVSPDMGRLEIRDPERGPRTLQGPVHRSPQLELDGDMHGTMVTQTIAETWFDVAQDGRFVLSGNDRDRFGVWDLREPSPAPQRLPMTRDDGFGVRAGALAHGGGFAVVRTRQPRQVSAWNLQSGTRLWSRDVRFDHGGSIAISPNDAWVAVLEGRDVLVLQASTGELVGTVPGAGSGEASAHTVAFGPWDSLLVGYGDGRIVCRPRP